MIPLSDLGKDKSARVTDIPEGHVLMRRLAEMGITRGTELRVIRPGGPVILDVRGHRLVLGRGIVQRVMVEPLEESG